MTDDFPRLNDTSDATSASSSRNDGVRTVHRIQPQAEFCATHTVHEFVARTREHVAGVQSQKTPDEFDRFLNGYQCRIFYFLWNQFSSLRNLPLIVGMKLNDKAQQSLGQRRFVAFTSRVQTVLRDHPTPKKLPDMRYLRELPEQIRLDIIDDARLETSQRVLGYIFDKVPIPVADANRSFRSWINLQLCSARKRNVRSAPNQERPRRKLKDGSSKPEGMARHLFDRIGQAERNRHTNAFRYSHSSGNELALAFDECLKGLSNRDKLVVQRLAEGDTTMNIARALDMNPKKQFQECAAIIRDVRRRMFLATSGLEDSANAALSSKFRATAILRMGDDDDNEASAARNAIQQTLPAGSRSRYCQSGMTRNGE